MTRQETKYYFSKTAVILTSIFLVIIVFLFSAFTCIFYITNQTIALFICLFIFLLFLTTFPGFYRRINFFLAGTPALILTEDELTDNINLQKLKWTDIKNISSQLIKMKIRVNYIALSLLNSENYIESIKNP